MSAACDQSKATQNLRVYITLDGEYAGIYDYFESKFSETFSVWWAFYMIAMVVRGDELEVDRWEIAVRKHVTGQVTIAGHGRDREFDGAIIPGGGLFLPINLSYLEDYPGEVIDMVADNPVTIEWHLNPHQTAAVLAAHPGGDVQIDLQGDILDELFVHIWENPDVDWSTEMQGEGVLPKVFK